MATRHPGGAGPDALTRREADVLRAIGRRLTNGELAEELHVSVRTVESHVASLRRKLGATSRGELIEAATRLARRSAVAGSESSFVGRDDELAALETRLAADRLVTLLGPAGVGKSRLARELARRWPGEVRLVDLVGVDGDDDGLAVAVADAIGVASAEGADVVGGLALALADRDLLLVVDNADPVAESLGRLLGPLVPASPGLRIVLTSRRRLGLAVEAVQPVNPLELPTDDRSRSVAASAAGRLLADRAAAVRPGFAVDRANAEAVARLCRRLDGLPLALELAAARLASIEVAELEAMLADRMDLLDQPGADRHRSLVAALDGSIAALSPGELEVLRAVASLPTACTLDELRVVVSAGAAGDAGRRDGADRGDAGIDTARAVLDLVDQSLLEPRLGPGPTTYRVLETIRSVVLDGLDGATLDRFRRAHATHHAGGVERAVGLALAAESWDYDDDVSRRTLLGALRWAADQPGPGDRELAERLLTGIARRYELDPTVAVLDELRRVVVDRALPDGWPTEPLAWAGVVLNYLDLELMERAAVAAVERADTPAEDALGRWAAGFADGYLGREASALGALAEARATFEAAGDREMVGLCLMAEGLVGSDPEAAVAALEASLLTCRRAGNRWHANSVRLMLARRAIEARIRLAEVPVWLDECDRFARDNAGLRHDRAHAVAARAEWAVASGTADVGLDLAGRAAEAFRRHGDLRCLVRALLLQAATEDDAATALVLARRAVGAAVLQGDRRAQATAVAAVVGLAPAAGDEVVGARARGAGHRLAGLAEPPADEQAGPLRTPVLEGFAEGPSLVALGPEVDGAGIG